MKPVYNRGKRTLVTCEKTYLRQPLLVQLLPFEQIVSTSGARILLYQGSPNSSSARTSPVAGFIECSC
jgi:hypothetical protein